MDVFFDGFENLYDAPDEDGVRDVISSPKWGQYYDAARIPSEILTALGVEEEDAPIKSFLSTADFSYSPSSPEQSNLEMSFKNWLAVQTKANGELYSENTRSQYISALKAVSTQFADAIAPFTSVLKLRMLILWKRRLLPSNLMLHTKSSTVVVAMVPCLQVLISTIAFCLNVKPSPPGIFAIVLVITVSFPVIVSSSVLPALVRALL